MAQCKQSAQEFIKNAFTPQIAVVCSPLAEKHCQKNNLNFIELLQPFSKLSNDVHYKDPNGSPITVRNLKLTFLNVESRPPQTSSARSYLNASVSELSECRAESFTCGDHQLQITLTTPWFEAWRDTFLRVQYPSDHEYIKHFLSCVLVVSSSETNPVESLIQLAQQLNSMQHNSPGKLPKWFNSNILKYYVIIHDNVEGNATKANESYEALKTAYGETNCFLLKMNSRPPGASDSDHLADPWSQFINSNIESREKQTPESSPYSSRLNFSPTSPEIGDGTTTGLDYHPLSPETEELSLSNSIADKEKPLPSAQRSKLHGYCLSTDDVEQVKLLIFEFCKTCLMPYIEKQLQQMNDVIANKKGVSRSFLSATKRWFNPNKPGAGSVAVNNLIYAPDSPELQVRRLGDLYFMFGHYTVAFQAYHLAKRDYNTDQAWLYYAGALEMASLAAFMANESNRKTCDYMEESITTYLNTCKMPQFATRATLLSSECLKSRGFYGEAAHQFIRMTSEESDLRSALFLEQAAYCFLHSKMLRKYAFHMVLAGHRFSKAAQRRHSLRSYKQAHQIYEGSGWDLAEDHIHFTIGRQAHNLRSFEEAVESFAKLLNGESKQSAQQQSTFLKEYLTILGNKLKNEENNSTPILALPAFKTGSLRLLMGPTRPLTTPGKVPALGVNFNDSETSESSARWHKLEELLVQEAAGAQPIIFKPLITLYTAGNVGKDNPLAIVNEPVQVCVTLTNSLQITLHMKDIFLLWSFDDEGATISNESPNAINDRYVKTHVAKSVLINANSHQDLVLHLTPLATGILFLKGICYTLTSSTTPTDSIFIIGKQLFTPENAKNPKLLQVNVVPLAPCLQVTFSEICLDFLCDEVQKVTIEFSNTGTVPLKKVLMATSLPNSLCNCEVRNDRAPIIVPNNCPPALRERLVRENHITAVPLPDNQLDPGQSTSLWIHVKAPNTPGPRTIDLLIYYESSDPQIKPKYRLVRHKWSLSVRESVQVQVETQESFNSKSVEELAVVIKTTNLNKVHSSIVTVISILNVGILSRLWKLSENIVTPKLIKLHSQESAHILLKARRNIDKKSVYSSTVLNPERAARERVNPAYMAFAMKTEQCQINVFDENDSLARPKENGTLFLQWQALVNDTNNKRMVNGQTQVDVVVNRGEVEDTDFDEFTGQIDAANLLQVSINKENAEQVTDNHPKVSYNLIHPPVVQHDFRQQKLCVIPVTLLLHSIEQTSTLNVIVNTLADESSAQSSTARSNLYYPFATRYFTWLGTGSAVLELKPLTYSRLELTVGVAKPGTFDLAARIEVHCNKIDQRDPPVLQNYLMQSALIVIDENS